MLAKAQGVVDWLVSDEIMTVGCLGCVRCCSSLKDVSREDCHQKFVSQNPSPGMKWARLKDWDLQRELFCTALRVVAQVFS